MNFHELAEASADQLALAWNDCYPEKYRVRGQTLAQQIFASPLLSEHGSAWIPGSGFVAIKRPASPSLYPGTETPTIHICALAFNESAAELLAHVEAYARENGITKIVFGADHDHLLPGCPTEALVVAEELERLGFEKQGDLASDLERDLADYEVPEGCLAPLELNEIQVRPAHQNDEFALEEFLLDAFPGRWAHDVMRKFRVDREPQQIDVLVKNSQVFGFSLTQNESSRHPIAGGVWREDLGENWASLGPIGISKEVRGSGLGNALLGASLLRLHQEGARQTIIDWTNLIAFYGGHGFNVTRRYQAYTKSLD